jgi:hypothetical protein
MGGQIRTFHICTTKPRSNNIIFRISCWSIRYFTNRKRSSFFVCNYTCTYTYTYIHVYMNSGGGHILLQDATRLVYITQDGSDYRRGSGHGFWARVCRWGHRASDTSLCAQVHRKKKFESQCPAIFTCYRRSLPMRNTFENTEHTIVGLFISCSRSLLTLLLLLAMERRYTEYFWEHRVSDTAVCAQVSLWVPF